MAQKNYLLIRSKFQEAFESKHGKDIPLRPKNIWLLHAGRLAQEMGSLALVDTQFGEQKNAQIKQFSQRAGQTKNVLMTVASREKCFMAVKGPSNDDLTGRPFRQIELSTASSDVKTAIYECISAIKNFDFYSNFKLFDGVFKANSQCCVLFGNPRDPAIGIIVTIAVSKLTKAIFFVVKEATAEAVKHLGLNVIVNISDSSFLLRSDQIVYSRPINIYKLMDHNGTIKSYTAQLF
jgi:hypothetical protein